MPNCLKKLKIGFKLTGRLISSFLRQFRYASSRLYSSLVINGFLKLRDKGNSGADGAITIFEVFAPKPNIGKSETLLKLD